MDRTNETKRNINKQRITLINQNVFVNCECNCSTITTAIKCTANSNGSNRCNSSLSATNCYSPTTLSDIRFGTDYELINFSMGNKFLKIVWLQLNVIFIKEDKMSNSGTLFHVVELLMIHTHIQLEKVLDHFYYF